MYRVLCHHYSMIHTVQPKHSLLSVKRLQRRSQTALGGWMGGGQRRREREGEWLSLSYGKRLSSLPSQREASEHPDFKSFGSWIFKYSRWWHFTMCRRWGLAEIGESVWSIDHCCCCPCLLCVSRCQLTRREKQWDMETRRRLALQGTLI